MVGFFFVVVYLDITEKGLGLFQRFSSISEEKIIFFSSALPYTPVDTYKLVDAKRTVMHSQMHIYSNGYFSRKGFWRAYKP